MRARYGARIFATAALRRSKSFIVENKLGADAVRVQMVDDAADAPAVERGSGERGGKSDAERRAAVLGRAIDHEVVGEVARWPKLMAEPHGAVRKHAPRRAELTGEDLERCARGPRESGVGREDGGEGAAVGGGR